ncbi:unnamed protein product, partial [Mesorhabditis spiculigera]
MLYALVLSLVCFVCATTATVAVFPAAVQTQIVNNFNSVRSQAARGVLRWANYTVDYDYEIQGEPSPWNKTYPKSTKLYSLKWDATLATQAVNRLKTYTAASHNMTFAQPATYGELTHGVMYGIAPNTYTAAQMFTKAWTGSWFGWLQSFGLPKMAYAKSDNQYQNMAYQLLAGTSQKIGCAYRNGTGTDNTWSVVCEMTPRGLTANVAVYPAGAICSACPAAAPCLPKAKGLCVPKA